MRFKESIIDMKALQRAFQTDLGVEEIKLTKYNQPSDWGRFDGIHVESVSGKAENSESEWYVFENEDDAEDFAKELIENDLEQEPYIFSPSWLNNFIYVSDIDRRVMAEDEASYRVSDMDEDELYEYLDRRDQSYFDSLDEDDPDREELLDKARDIVEDEVYNEWFDGLADPIQFLVEDMGFYSLEDLMKQSFIQIDYREASQDAVDVDGVAHFLDRYDGREEEIKDPVTRKTFIVYGTN